MQKLKLCSFFSLMSDFKFFIWTVWVFSPSSFWHRDEEKTQVDSKRLEQWNDEWHVLCGSRDDDVSRSLWPCRLEVWPLTAATWPSKQLFVVRNEVRVSASAPLNVISSARGVTLKLIPGSLILDTLSGRKESLHQHANSINRRLVMLCYRFEETRVIWKDNNVSVAVVRWDRLWCRELERDHSSWGNQWTSDAEIHLLLKMKDRFCKLMCVKCGGEHSRLEGAVFRMSNTPLPGEAV